MANDRCDTTYCDSFILHHICYSVHLNMCIADVNQLSHVASRRLLQCIVFARLTLISLYQFTWSISMIWCELFWNILISSNLKKKIVSRNLIWKFAEIVDLSEFKFRQSNFFNFRAFFLETRNISFTTFILVWALA